jgi:chromosome segregation ATPase
MLVSSDSPPQQKALAKQVIELQYKLKEKSLKLDEAEQTIDLLRRSLDTSQAELQQALSKNHNLEKRLQSIVKTPLAESEVAPEFIRNMTASFKKTTGELSHECGEV